MHNSILKDINLSYNSYNEIIFSDNECKILCEKTFIDEPLLNKYSNMNSIIIARKIALSWIAYNNIAIEDVVISVKSIYFSEQEYNNLDITGYKISHEILKKRKDKVDEIKISILKNIKDESDKIEFIFCFISQGLTRFVRAGRNYSNYLEESIENEEGYYEDRNIYVPGELDRIVDKVRVDHIPAITLLKISDDFIKNKIKNLQKIKTLYASFYKYTDPRKKLNINFNNQNELIFNQDNTLVAKVKIL